ncbi:MAG TPA: hypothetical protein VKS81_05980 [Bacteroidota bacterium]|nr:hypothetical protein [Bacteroidota bacterium]
MTRQSAPTLSNIVQSCALLKEVKKCEMTKGDIVYIKTHNSTYTLASNGNGMFEVSGGWFSAHGADRTCLKVNGCTWGGSAIKTDIVAACGLMLEFGNRVKTSRIKKIYVLSHFRLQ